MERLDDLLGALRPGLLDRAGRLTGRLASDDRVRAVLLSGSAAEGRADEYSDLDLAVIVADAGAVESLAADVPGLAGEVVHHTTLARGPVRVVSCVSADWSRVDVLVEPMAVAARRGHPPFVALSDPDGITADLRRQRGGVPADPLGLVTEFLRVLGLLDVVLGREEYFVGAQGVVLLQDQLVDLFLAEHGRGRAGGAKRVSADLSGEQRAVLDGLPPISHTRESVLAGHRAVAAAFLPRARALLDRTGDTWPDEFYQATRRHLAEAGLVELPG